MRSRSTEHLGKQKLVHGPLHHQPEGNEDTDEDLTTKQKFIVKSVPEGLICQVAPHFNRRCHRVQDGRFTSDFNDDFFVFAELILVLIFTLCI